jgi:hypothetical protein
MCNKFQGYGRRHSQIVDIPLQGGLLCHYRIYFKIVKLFSKLFQSEGKIGFDGGSGKIRTRYDFIIFKMIKFQGPMDFLWNCL